MSNLPPIDGSYRDRDCVEWFPTDAEGGPLISEFAEVTRLADLVRTRGPVVGHFQAPEEPS